MAVDPATSLYGGRAKERRTLRQGGLRGPALASGLADWKAQQEARAGGVVQNLGFDPALGQSVGDPSKFLRKLQAGKGPAVRRMQFLQAASGPYQKAQQQLEAEQSAALAAGAPVDLKEDAALQPVFGKLQEYVSKNLGIGLTPEQMASFRASLTAPIQAGAQQAGAAESTALATSGIDPRSGVARRRAMELQRGKEQGLQGAENQLAQMDLSRIRDFESMAQGVSAAEEGRRQYDVDANLRRLAQVEGGMRSLAGLREGQREYDVNYTESQRQAALWRRMAKEAAKAMEPSTLEKVAGGIGGLVGGLSGGS